MSGESTSRPLPFGRGTRSTLLLLSGIVAASVAPGAGASERGRTDRTAGASLVADAPLGIEGDIATGTRRVPAERSAGSVAEGGARQVARYEWDIPDWLPPPPVPRDNPMSAAKVRLGRHLFHDRRLSADGSVACASCHEQSLGFSDGRATAVGIHGTPSRRNSMSLSNVGYSPVLTWGNPHMTSLERQALVPLFGEEPLEMGNGGRERTLFARIGADPHYARMFRAAFPERDGRIDPATLTHALAAFERTLISVDSPYDRYRYGGDETALSASALRGEALFFSERAECYHCHQGFNFSDTLQTSRGGFAEIAFHNTGLYNMDGRGAYPSGQHGLREFTARAADMGRFRTQSLRNVAVSAPYFHDGSAATLDEVIDHYAAGGRTLEGARAGAGRDSPWKDPLVGGFTLQGTDREDLKAFLHSLTDETFLEDPRFSNPWPAGHPARGRDTVPSIPTVPSTP